MSEKVFDGGLLPGKVALGIDQSLSGFAMTALNIDRPEAYETWVYKSEHRGVRRLADIKWWLENKFDFLETNGHRVEAIAMEAPVMASPSTLPLAELSGVIRLAIWDYFDENKYSIIPFEEHLRKPYLIPPMTLKKYAAGKGNAKKQEVLLQIYKRWGIEFNDDNAADSYALARLAAGVAITAVEKAVVEQITDPKYKDK
jgi:Holliday junction resolvasome RuvABC endonuclease subunit